MVIRIHGRKKETKASEEAGIVNGRWGSKRFTNVVERKD